MNRPVSHEELSQKSSGGFQWHRRRKEPNCDACKAVHAALMRQRYQASQVPGWVATRRRKQHDQVVGTFTGREWHQRRGERPCEECLAAYNAWQKARRLRLKAAKLAEA